MSLFPVHGVNRKEMWSLRVGSDDVSKLSHGLCYNSNRQRDVLEKCVARGASTSLTTSLFTSMAFPLPDHLPRAGFSAEGSSFGSTTSHAEPFLKKIASTKPSEITKQQASTWVNDLNNAIEETKTRIHSRIQSDLPSFERQLENAEQVKSRLRSLSTSVDEIDSSLNDSQTGLLPKTLQTLSAHSSLAQQHQDIRTKHESLLVLQICVNDYKALTKLVSEGKLADAAKKSEMLHELSESVAEPLSISKVFIDFKRKLRTLRDSLHEQLSDAYSRSVIVSSVPSDLRIAIFDQIQVRNCSAVIHLTEICNSLPAETLQSKLAALRKEFVAKFIDHVLIRPSSVSTSSYGHTHTLSMNVPSLAVSAPLSNVQKLLEYLHTHLIRCLPSPINTAFSSQLYSPVTSSIMTHLLKPSIPSHISQLPSFLSLVASAVQLESHISTELNIRINQAKDIDEWSTNVGAHYEKKRREELIQNMRDLLADNSPEDEGVGIRVNAELVHHDEPAVNGALELRSGSIDIPQDTQMEADNDDGAGWDFDDGVANEESNPSTASEKKDENILDLGEDDGWNFDDEPAPEASASSETPQTNGDDNAAEPEDGWGFDDPPDSPQAPLPLSPPKREAKGLQRHAGKSQSINVASPVSPATQTVSSPQKSIASFQVKQPVSMAPETYLISPIVKRVQNIVEQTLAEGQALADSTIFQDKNPQRGSLLLLTAPAVLDLYRAIYPISRSASLQKPSSLSADSIRFSNDCKYLSSYVEKVIKGKTAQASLSPSVWGKEKLEQTRDRLKELSESSYEEVLSRETDAILSMVGRIDGFSDIADELQFAKCESVFEQVVSDLTDTGRHWKNTLTRSMYFEAMGSLIDEALCRITDDIIAMPDIPEVESHKLDELLKLLKPLEDLFADGDEPSVIATYVPSWLKTQYLGELLEASIADISYLFDEGLLIDFEVKELIQLLRALFAETPLRTRTIEKISAGHPVSTRS